MAYPPFMNGYGTAAKILNKIKEAQTPDRFTQDFLATKLGFPGGTPRPFIPLAKRLGLLESDGRPTNLYNSFRNSHQSRAAMAAAVRKGYSQLYERNEYVHDLQKDKLEGLVVEVTGLPKGHGTVNSIVGTFETLKKFADFNKPEPKSTSNIEEIGSSNGKQPPITNSGDEGEDVQFNLAYTINLVLPKTNDVAVFNAIFKSLREHLIRR